MSEWLEKYRLAVGFGLAGLVLVGLGIFWWKSEALGEKTKVEIVSGDTEEEPSEPGRLIVDVEGAVSSPGIYRLTSNARVTDAVKAAGGLAEEADEVWVQKNLNQAEKLKDGMKIYIPSKAKVENSLSKVQDESNKININSASESELDKLPGIGVVTAQKIISSRPYGRVEELIERKVVTQKVWEGIKDLVAVW